MIDLPHEDAPPFIHLLPLASESGAYHLPAPQAPILIDSVEALGFALHRVDLHACRDADALYDRFARALEFPPWFGRNWDALADCLSDLGWLDASPGHVLLIENSAELQGSEHGDYDTLVSVLEDVASNWRQAGIAFWAFLCEQRAS